MPLFPHFLLTVAAGFAASLSARADLRVSPKPAAFSRAFMAYLMFAVLLLLPSSVYFYVFHGDWYLLYLVDTARVPSAVALVGCVAEVGCGAASFLLGASLLRSQRDSVLGAAIGLSVSLGLGGVMVARKRLGVVGSYAQYHGDFGLSAYGGALLQGSLWMSLWVALGLCYLLYRLGPGARRA